MCNVNAIFRCRLFGIFGAAGFGFRSEASLFQVLPGPPRQKRPPWRTTFLHFWAQQDLASGRAHRARSLQPASAPKTTSCRFALPSGRAGAPFQVLPAPAAKKGTPPCGGIPFFWAQQDLNLKTLC